MYIQAVLSYDFIQNVLVSLILTLKSLNFDFIEQLDPDAGLGCHPYHITIIGNVASCFPCTDEIDRYLSRWNHDLDYIKIKPINKIRISKNGNVTLLIKSLGLKEVAHDIFETIKLKSTYNLNPYYYSKYFHITLGVTRNSKWFGQEITINIPTKSYTLEKFSWNY